MQKKPPELPRQYEVLMDQEVSLNNGPSHIWFAKSTPNGYGSSK